MKKTITVNELKAMLNTLSEEGYGDAVLWYRDENSMDIELEAGIWDVWEDDHGKGVALA